MSHEIFGKKTFELSAILTEFGYQRNVTLEQRYERKGHQFRKNISECALLFDPFTRYETNIYLTTYAGTGEYLVPAE